MSSAPTKIHIGGPTAAPATLHGMATTLKERLELAMKGPPKVTQAAIAKACKIAPPSVSDWMSGKTKTIAGKNLLAAARLLNVNPEWLGTGRGPMRPERLTSHPTNVTGDQYSTATPTTPSRLMGLDITTLHEALTLLFQDMDQAGDFPTLLARTQRLAELYGRVEAEGGRLSAESYRRFDEEIEQRRGKGGEQSIRGKRIHGRH